MTLNEYITTHTIEWNDLKNDLDYVLFLNYLNERFYDFNLLYPESTFLRLLKNELENNRLSLQSINFTIYQNKDLNPIVKESLGNLINAESDNLTTNTIGVAGFNAIGKNQVSTYESKNPNKVQNINYFDEIYKRNQTLFNPYFNDLAKNFIKLFQINYV